MALEDERISSLRTKTVIKTRIGRARIQLEFTIRSRVACRTVARVTGGTRDTSAVIRTGRTSAQIDHVLA